MPGPPPLARTLRVWSCLEVDPGVYVRCASEVPDEGRTFQTPDIPLLVAAQIFVLVELQMNPIETAVGLEG